MCMLFSICFSASIASNTQDEKVSYLDLLLLSLSEDTKNYVLAIQLLGEENNEAKDFLQGNLISKIDDLIHHLSISENKKTIRLVCETQKRLGKSIMKITNQCALEELCEKNYYLTNMCIAKEMCIGKEKDEEKEK